MNNTHPHNTAPAPGEIELQLKAYDNVELLAVGGMGAVYKARQISLDRPVAIKFLTHACSASLQFRRIFKREAQTMARLNHSNLVSIYDYGEINGMLYIVMQYIEGRTLHAAANGRAVTQNEAVSLVAKISRALSHAHHSGILHRDIKPANILIDSELNPIVVDFGLAHQTQDSAMKGDTVFGTPGYTAPEILAPPYRADQRADIFSLGVLLHELLTGQLPQTPYHPPSRLAPVDPRYDTIVMRAIHPSPALRYPGTEALAEDLEKILNGQELATTSLLSNPVTHPKLATTSPPTRIPVTATPPSAITTLPSLSRPRTPNLKSAIVILAACITLALAVITLIISTHPPDNQPPVASGGIPSAPADNR